MKENDTQKRKRKLVRYSEAFKLQVVSELESGRFGSPHEASQAYGITGRETVKRWLQSFGKEFLSTRVIRVEKQGEPSEISRLKARVRKLESSLANAHMDLALDRAYFEMLCEQTSIDPSEFKKKHDGTASTEPKSKRARRAKN